MKFLIIVGIIFVASSAYAELSLYDKDTLRNVPANNITKLLIDSEGYPVEDYDVTTSDGYILKVFRIPGSTISPPAEGKPIAYLQHDILLSSADWVIAGPRKGLAYILVDLGYDVWMPNARGSRFIRKRVYMPDQEFFSNYWNFSWHEIGVVDVPETIDFVLQKTGQSKLHYIGHGQGSTVFFVMASMLPNMNAKIISMNALAPLAFMSHSRSPVFDVITQSFNYVGRVTSLLGVSEFRPSKNLIIQGGKPTCLIESPFKELCDSILFLLAGYNSVQLNSTIIPAILKITPAGASVRQMTHYAQLINSGKFRMYDYGFKVNKFKYGTLTPPNYNLDAVTAPVYLHYSDDDWLADSQDVDELASKLGNLAGKYRITVPKFNHLDYVYGINAPTALYKKVILLMDRY